MILFKALKVNHHIYNLALNKINPDRSLKGYEMLTRLVLFIKVVFVLYVNRQYYLYKNDLFLEANFGTNELMWSQLPNSFLTNFGKFLQSHLAANLKKASGLGAGVTG